VARWAAFINRQKNPDASWLTVDAGDYVDRAGTGGCSSKCQFMVTSYEDLHYDVLNIGKQEVWMGYDALDSLIRATKAAKHTQFVSANLVNVKSHRPITSPTVIKEYGHFRVGLIGLLSESDFPRGSSLLDSVHLAVTPYMDAAKKYLPSLLGFTQYQDQLTDAYDEKGEWSDKLAAFNAMPVNPVSSAPPVKPVTQPLTTSQVNKGLPPASLTSPTQTPNTSPSAVSTKPTKN